MQRVHTGDDRRKGGRNLRVACIRPVLLSVPDISMDRRVKGRLNLSGGAGKLNDRAPLGHLGDLEAMRPEPGGDRLDVLVGGAKLLSEFLRREPSVIVRGGPLLLLGERLPARDYAGAQAACGPSRGSTAPGRGRILGGPGDACCP